LVGLAFIIVIGILLSDHMATTTEPTQAALDTAAQHARGAIVVPNENLGGATIPQQITPREIAPSNPIPTRNDVTRPPVVTEISIGTPTPGGTPVAPRGASVTPQLTQPAGQNTVVVHEPTQPAGQTETATSVTPAPSAGVDPGLIETARSV